MEGPKLASSSGEEGGERSPARNGVVGLSQTLDGRLLLEGEKSRCDDERLKKIDRAVRGLVLSRYGLREQTPSSAGDDSLSSKIAKLAFGGLWGSSSDIWSIQDLISPSLLPNFRQLTALSLHNCTLDALPPIGDKLETLSLRCCTEGGPGSGRWRFTQLKALKAISLRICVSGLEFDPTDHQTAQLTSLTVRDHRDGKNAISDKSFGTLPASLKEVHLHGLDVTEITVKKLPRKTLNRLVIQNCPNLPHTGRLKALFPHCQCVALKSGETEHERMLRVLKRVQGQPQAINRMLEVLISITGEMSSGEAPQAVLFLTGPSGTGKTELAKTVAALMKRPFLRFDMAEYSTRWCITKLIGSGKGYIDSWKGGSLTNAVMKHPNAVVLLDEIEKASPEVIKLFLGVFDAGRLTDGLDKLVDFSNTIIIMTSNLGATRIASLNWTGVEAALERSRLIAVDLLKQRVAPELAGRLTGVIPFRPLSRESIVGILRSRTATIAAEIGKSKGLTISIGDGVWRSVIPARLDPSLGVRPLIKALEGKIKSVISKKMLEGVICKGDRIHVAKNAHDDSLSVEVR